MPNFIAIVVRALVGTLSFIVSFFVLDAIRDRNTEIVVACVGLIPSPIDQYLCAQSRIPMEMMRHG
jgi:hypothetical protein